VDCLDVVVELVEDAVVVSVSGSGSACGSADEVPSVGLGVDVRVGVVVEERSSVE